MTDKQDEASETPRYCQMGSAMIPTSNSFDGKPAGDWVKASDYDDLERRLRVAEVWKGDFVEACRQMDVAEARIKELEERLAKEHETSRLSLEEAYAFVSEANTELTAEREARKGLEEFYNGVKECMGDTWQCKHCGDSEPWWTDSNADYFTRKAQAALGSRAGEGE